jgi:hypothetical protein
MKLNDKYRRPDDERVSRLVLSLGGLIGAFVIFVPTVRAEGDRCYGAWQDAYHYGRGVLSDPDAEYRTLSRVHVECGGRVGYVGVSDFHGASGIVDVWVCDDTSHHQCGVNTISSESDEFVDCYAQVWSGDSRCPGTTLEGPIESGRPTSGYETRVYTDGPDIGLQPIDDRGNWLDCSPDYIRAVCITNR